MKITMKSINGNVINGDVVIDGRSFSGRNIKIDGNKVIVDGVTQEGELIGDVNVTVNGDVEFLQTECGDVKAESAQNIKTVSGDVTCLNVSGSVNTVSGDVNCASVSGSVNTVSGDISHR